MKSYRQHRACGGGIVYAGPAPDGRPQYRCSKCGETWTCGTDGGPWAEIAREAVAATVNSRPGA